MHLAGQDVISRATRASGKTLVSLSFVVWFVKFVDAPIGDAVISGVSLPESNNGYGFVQWVVMIPLLLHHVMNWWGDRLSYRGWNDPTKITLSAGFGSATGLMTRLDAVLRTVKEKFGQSNGEESIAIHHLREINTQVRLLSTFAGLYILLWIGFPVVCCGISLLWR